jgi:phage terminase large subunit-like protein
MSTTLHGLPQGENSWGADITTENRVEVLRHHFQIELLPWQLEVFQALGGIPRPRAAYISISRKSGKSLLAAAFILSELLLEPESEIYVFSDSERNLKAVLIQEMKRLVHRDHPDVWKIHYDSIVHRETGAFVRVRPSNHAATQGINPTLCVMDEVHLQKSDEIWNGCLMAGAAKPHPLMLGITTPGYDTTSLAHDLHQQVVAEAPDLWGKIYQPSNSLIAYTDEEQWAEANPGLGYTFNIESLRQDHRLLPEHEFRRFRLGMWTATASAWLPYMAFEACADPEREVEEGTRVWLGFDGSYSGDSTALVGVTEDLHVFVVGCWENPGRKGWRVPRDEVDEALTIAFQRYKVVELLCDPPYWQREISEWERRWPRKVLEFPTGTRQRMAPACTTFYSAVLEQQLTHDGDKRLARHISNCVVKTSPFGDYVTKVDKNSPAKIDLAVATIIAYSRASLVKTRAPLVLL